MHKNIIFILLIFIPCSNFFSQTIVSKTNDKVIIAHRGASGYLPEHTMESKVMAFAMHPDFIEQDLVLSKDGVPIVIHDIYLDDITDVAEKFPNKSRDDNRFYVIDFTYKELLQLNVLERFNPKTKEAVFPNRFPYGKSHFNLHSLQDEIELIQGLNKSTGNDIGIYPEIKNPKFHRENGKDISKIVLDILNDYGYRTRSDNCILQCFDAPELKRIRIDLKSELFLVQLIGWKLEEGQLENYQSYADGIGPSIKHIINGFDKNGNVIYSDLVKNAHDLNLIVHAFTFRADQLEGIPSFEKLLELGFIGANVDGIFTDFPDKVSDFMNENSQ